MSETDQELIELVEQKTPDELTLEEIEHLQRRLAESPVLREKLYEQLQMEQYLADVLGRSQVSIDSIMSEVAQRRSRRRRLLWMGFGACLLVAASVWFATRPHDPAGPIAAGPPDDESPEDQSPQDMSIED